MEEGGNVRNDPHGEFTGRNILFEAHTPEQNRWEKIFSSNRTGQTPPSAPRRQDPDLMEWPDDFRFRERRRDSGPPALCRSGTPRRRFPPDDSAASRWLSAAPLSRRRRRDRRHARRLCVLRPGPARSLRGYLRIPLSRRRAGDHGEAARAFRRRRSAADSSLRPNPMPRP